MTKKKEHQPITCGIKHRFIGDYINILPLFALTILLALFTLPGCKKNQEPQAPAAADLPQVTTSAISNITKTQAEGGGNVISQGSSTIISCGVCYDTNPNPTILSHFTDYGTLQGVFYSYLHELSQNTTYFVRAYATNRSGTAYGEQQTFRTLWDSGYATVITHNPTYVSMSWFSIGGKVVEDGGVSVTESGICWSLSPLPTTGSHKIACSAGVGGFLAEVQGLEMNTLYFVRAYAINATGTSYGGEKQIRTLGYPVLFVPGSYQGWNPGDSSAVITSVKGNERYEGYFWFPANTEYKFTQGPNWSVYWGDNNHDGNLQPNGANLAVVQEGYYWINVDLAALRHTFLKTTWAITGTATPGGWTSDTDLAYDAVAKVWTVTTLLTAGDFKFRANHNWDLNYGDDNADGTLEAGGSNIVVASAGLYTIVLDFSKPVYKYTLIKK